MLTTVLLAAVLTATPAITDVPQRADGSICYTVMTGDGRQVSGRILGLAPGADPEIKNRVLGLYQTQALDALKLGAGSMSTEARIYPRVCIDCSGAGGSITTYHGLWLGAVGRCLICKGNECVVTCHTWPGWPPCPPPCP